VIPSDQSVGSEGTLLGDVTNNGVLRPGASPGKLIIEGDYTQSAVGTLEIEIAGEDAALFDLLEVNGTASLAGTLEVSLLNDRTPQSNDSYTILTAAVLTGQFSNAASDIDFAGGRFDVIYSPTSVTLTNFSPVLEPAGMVSAALGATMSLRRRRGHASSGS
jgi:hypothetical protein